MALTGAEYLESLRDGREVWLGGTRVADVAEHVGFRHAARTIADLYDSLHAPDADALRWITPTGAISHRAFQPARTRQQLAERAHAMGLWARRHFGFLGRSPDYKGGLAVSLEGHADLFGAFAPNARRWAGELRDRVLFANHVGVNPMVDRSKRPHELPEVNVRAVAERDSGIVVRGAKMIGTAALFTHCSLVFSSAPVPLDGRDLEQALVFFVRSNAPGLKLICRRSYEAEAKHPFDHPLSSRFDENDATVVFDDVFVPWEDVLVHRDPQLANEFFVRAQIVQNLMLHGAVRFATKMRFLVGLLIRLSRQAGSDSFRGVRAQLGEAVGWTWMFESLVRDACQRPDPAPGGTFAPSHRAIFAARALAPWIYPKVRAAFLDLGAGGFMQIPGTVQDLLAEELSPVMNRYFRGRDVSPSERAKLWKLAWDAVGSEFGGRQELFERSFAGSFDNVRLENLFLAEHNGDAENWGVLAEEAMGSYDEGGWKADSPWAG